MTRTQLCKVSCVLSTLLIVALAGCSGDDDSASSDATTPDTVAATTESPTTVEPTTTALREVDPCAVVTHDEAQNAVSTPLNDATPVRTGDEASCTYTGPTTGPLAQVEVYVGPGAKKYLDIDQQLQHVFTPLAGVGDEATTEPFGAFVRVGSTWVAIRLTRLVDAATLQPALEALARTAATRL